MSLAAPAPVMPTVAEFAREVHAFLDDLDPARTFGETSLAAARDALNALHAYAGRLQAAWDGVPPVSGAEAHLRAAVARLHDALPEPTGISDALPEWFDLRERLSAHYEVMAVALAADSGGADVRHLRPTNYARNLFHVGTGMLAVLSFEHLLEPWSVRVLAGFFFAWGWSMEVSRIFSPRINAFLMWCFSPVAHPHEAVRVNSASWYATAVFIIALISPDKAGVLGLLVLAVGDPVAAIVGRRFGRTKILGPKSLEGFGGFVLAAGGASAVYLGVYHAEIGMVGIAALATAAAIAGGMAELFTRRLDDNMTIPVVTTLAAMAVGLLL